MVINNHFKLYSNHLKYMMNRGKQACSLNTHISEYVKSDLFYG